MKYEWPVVIALLLIFAFAGALAITDFGQSWDEATNYLYGEKALGYYLQGRFLRDPGEKYFHGTFYFMIWAQASKLINQLPGVWIEPDARHYVNYMTFLSGALGLYAIARRFAGPEGAGIAIVLFLTQPLLIGHAFINQKDTPFMAVFVLTVVLGISMAESWIEIAEHLKSRGANSIRAVVSLCRGWAKNWRQLPFLGRWARTAGFVAACVMALDVAGSLIAYPMLRALVISAYQGTAPGLIAKLFNQIAQDAWKTPLDAYLFKLEVAHFWMRIPLLAILGGIGSFFFYLLTPKRDRPLWRSLIKTTALTLVSASVLGSLIAMRVIGIFAGLLVSGYLLIYRRKKSLTPMAIYWTFALSVLYLAWPTLWGDPFGRLWTRLVEATSFAPHAVLFEGRHILSNELPWYFLPKMMAYQLTEPVLSLALLGGFRVVSKVFREGLSGNEVSLVLLAWFAVPFLAQVTLGIPIYGNFRQLLFIVPPLIIIAGDGLKALLCAIRPRGIRLLLAILAIAPGLVKIVDLHPYQYAYYNRIAGEWSELQGEYEMDYWCTSYRHAMDYINKEAPDGAIVEAWGPADAANAFARQDIEVTWYSDPPTGDYLLLCDDGLDRSTFSDWTTVFSIEKKGVTLALVKQGSGDGS